MEKAWMKARVGALSKLIGARRDSPFQSLNVPHRVVLCLVISDGLKRKGDL
jgi:hypothetical protein